MLSKTEARARLARTLMKAISSSSLTVNDVKRLLKARAGIKVIRQRKGR